jgi:tol-pal system protein YbgF
VTALVLAVSSAACATRSSVSRVQTEVTTLGSNVQALRRSHEQAVGDLRQIGEGLRTTQARLVAITTQVSEATDATRRLGEQVDGTSTVLNQLREAVERAAHPPQQLSAPVPAVAVPADRSPAPPTPTDQAKKAYASALGVFQSHEHGQAVLDFLGFLSQYPKHPLASNAQYWIGEAYYAQRDYRQAAVEFQKVLDRNPRGGKAPDALVKVGLCYINLRQRARAHESWQHVVREFPDSDAAVKARTLIHRYADSAHRAR